MADLSEVSAILLTNPAGKNQYMAFPLDPDLPETPYILKNIDGLDPADNAINMTELTGGGRAFNGSRATGRRLVLTLGYNPTAAPGWSIAELKQFLYRNFGGDALETPLSIKLLSGYSFYQYSSPTTLTNEFLQWYYPGTTGELAITYGYLVSMAANPFSKEPEIILTIDCEGSYFMDLKATRSSGGVFPLTINNAGDVPTGLYMEFTVQYESTGLVLYNNNKALNINYTFPAGAKVTIDSNFGAKTAFVQLTSSASKINLLPYMSGQDWIVLNQGTNVITSSWSDDAIASVYTEYVQRYLGA